jgi:hypothetical protein
LYRAPLNAVDALARHSRSQVPALVLLVPLYDVVPAHRPGVVALALQVAVNDVAPHGETRPVLNS